MMGHEMNNWKEKSELAFRGHHIVAAGSCSVAHTLAGFVSNL
jgi:hypothetical protein